MSLQRTNVTAALEDTVTSLHPFGEMVTPIEKMTFQSLPPTHPPINLLVGVGDILRLFLCHPLSPFYYPLLAFREVICTEA